ncbi:hypothetical protein BJY59DRAFT_470456 [Rhodotorula toruloides]
MQAEHDGRSGILGVHNACRRERMSVSSPILFPPRAILPAFALNALSGELVAPSSPDCATSRHNNLRRPPTRSAAVGVDLLSVKNRWTSASAGDHQGSLAALERISAGSRAKEWRRARRCLRRSRWETCGRRSPRSQLAEVLASFRGRRSVYRRPWPRNLVEYSFKRDQRDEKGESRPPFLLVLLFAHHASSPHPLSHPLVWRPNAQRSFPKHRLELR